MEDKLGKLLNVPPLLPTVKEENLPVPTTNQKQNWNKHTATSM